MAKVDLKYVYGSLVIISIILGGAYVYFEITKDYTSLYKNNELLAKEKWIVNEISGRNSATTVKSINLSNGYKIIKRAPYYKGTSRFAYLYEYFYFSKETDNIEKFPDNYQVKFEPKNKNTEYQIIWIIYDIKGVNFTNEISNNCVYKYGNLKIDLKNECSKLEKAILNNNEIRFYFKSIKGNQEFNPLFIDPPVNLITFNLDGINESKYYEYQSRINLSAYTESLTDICISIDHPEFGENYTCASSVKALNLSFLIPGLYTTNFSVNDKSVGGGTPLITNVSLKGNRTYLYASLNISGHQLSGYPKNITIDLFQDGIPDFMCRNTINGKTININSFTNDLTTETLLFSTANSINTRYFNYSFNMGLDVVNGTFDVYGSPNNPSSLSFYDLLINTSKILRIVDASMPYFVWENFSLGAISGRWSGSYNIGTYSGNPAIYAYSGLYNAQTCSEISGSGEFKSQTMDIDKYGSVKFRAVLSGNSQCHEDSSPSGCNSGASQSYLYLIDKTSSSNIATIKAATTGCGCGAPFDSCSSNNFDDSIWEIRKSGTNFQIYDDGSLSQTVTFDPAHQFEVKLYAYASGRGQCNCPAYGNVGGSGYSYSYLLPINASGIRGKPLISPFQWGNGTVESQQIAKFSSNIVSAKLTATQTLPSGAIITYQMAADNNTFETVTNGVTHTFVVPGQYLRWRIVVNGTHTTVTDDNEATIYDINIEVGQGFPSNISIDIGGDGTYEFQDNKTINSTTSLLTVNLSRNPIISYLYANCNNQLTCKVPIAIKSATAGGLRVTNITLNQTINGIIFNYSKITEKAINNSIINISITSDRGYINLTDLRFKYI